ncbi:CapA family protein [Lacticaseibacillus absianus]|uniref:CapA family protein n=1 Tax=Lacticaseibacillus absianus TaxID=2729623 RepID=UPI0015CAAF7F|nr:CapA family protein [Lacticaseibacillus absianus]
MKSGKGLRGAGVALAALMVLAGCGAQGGAGSRTAGSATKSASRSSATKSARSSSQSSSHQQQAASASSQAQPATVRLTFMGDDTLGTDPAFNAATSLPTVWANNGKAPTYFFQNVASYFKADDLTIANLETTFTTSNTQANKGGGVVFHFKGDPELVSALTSSSIEAVTVANNHIYDYGQQGFKDTIATLQGAKVGYFGEGYQYTKTVNGVKLGFLGYQGWTATDKDLAKIRSDIAGMKKAGCQLVIPYFHWGIEREPRPYATQTTLAHAAIDAGAAMVIGSHPHVIQSMELYKGKLIAYSMSNFCFGGNSNPGDKRSFLLQTNLTVQGDDVKAAQFRVIPTRISSTDSYNDYKPTPYTGSAATAVLRYMNELSPTFSGRISSRFTPIAQ